MQYTYDQNGDEVSSMETVKDVNIFTRTERHVDSDTGNITETKRRILIDKIGNRTSAITKQLIDDEFKVIDEIKYEREESDDSKSKKRTHTSYDADGNIIYKSIHNEYVNETEEVHEHEVYDYKVDGE